MNSHIKRFYYSEEINRFCNEDKSSILGKLVERHEFSLEEQQRNSWEFQIRNLQVWLKDIEGQVIFEYSIPRMGKRIDCLVISGAVVFAIEFKVGASKFEKHAINQVLDYALDLKNFHEQSHNKIVVPVLICTEAEQESLQLNLYEDGLAKVLHSSGKSIASLIQNITDEIQQKSIVISEWIDSSYKPTPTIIEAAQALFQGHSVEEISRSDAGAINLSRTAKALSEIIQYSKIKKKKTICFLTGVPGAGKTLAGLNLANSWHNEKESEHAVFLSGNGPLVDVLREALARNEVEVKKEKGDKSKKSLSLSKAKAFIQNIHHFRDDGLANEAPPIERVVIFDEAQRAWSLKQTAAFMKKKKGLPNFNQSEPEFLISLMDRHSDWATIICLIGGGQEINTGEGGIHGWFETLERSFPDWSIYTSSNLTDHEYTHGRILFSPLLSNKIHYNDNLHLSVSIRSYRSEKVAAFVKATLDCNLADAQQLYLEIKQTYPIVLTRNLSKAKAWLKNKARGSERYGLTASSGGIRLKPYGINVKSTIDPKNWFLNNDTDIRSSYFLEDVATEFDIQGLELDWTCLAWDADFRHDGLGWISKAFRGTVWQNINDGNSKLYLKNAYRVLLTRARQGMVLFIPYGDESDQTRLPAYYDSTYKYLCSIGIKSLDD